MTPTVRSADADAPTLQTADAAYFTCLLLGQLGQYNPKGDLTMPIILVVDDDMLVRRATARYLRARGFTVIETHCASGAREILRTRKDIFGVVTDFDLGDGTGRDVCAEAAAANVPRRIIHTGSTHATPFTTDDAVLLKPALPMIVELLEGAA